MNQRIQLLDSLRGFALFGILIANLLIFQYGAIGKEYLHDLSFSDTIGYYMTKIVFEGSFMPIFTFLFGYSLIKFVESVKARQPKARWVLVRRALGLFILGILHSSFVWEGDILFFYGQLSLLLIFFIYRKPATLVIWAALIFIAIAIFSYGPEGSLYDPNKIHAYLQQENATLSTGSYKDIIEFRQQSEVPYNEEAFSGNLLLLAILLAPILHLPMFLVGMASAKWQLFTAPERERSLYKKLLLLVVMGLLLKSVAQFESNVASIFSTAGGPLLSLGYIGAFALIYQSASYTTVLSAFSAVGKLSLSNYLMQSLIFTYIFYGYGLGLFGTLGIPAAMLIALVVFLIQMALSTLYLRYFSRGPIEALLRLWTNLSLRKTRQ